MARVDLRKVAKVYRGGVRAVDQFSLAVADREFVALVGPSGCGKSTILRMIAGLEPITEGTIAIDGRRVDGLPPRDRDVAMVFQNYALYPHMTVYGNLAFGLRLRGGTKAETDRKVREAATLLGIEDLLHRKPQALSGGQRQRVAVGRAIVRRPKAFLFDEPLSSLDAKLRLEMRAELKRLHRRLATTTVYVTHDQAEAMALADRVVVMKDGVVQQAASPSEAWGKPANRFVAAFVGSASMNFLEGQLARANDALYFDEGSCRVRLPASAGERGAWAGRPLVLGVRPEDMAMAATGRFEHPENVLSVRVRVVETLGDKMELRVQTPVHDNVVCYVDARDGIVEGTDLMLHLDMHRVHLFEPGEVGRRVSLDDGGD